jgi:hypothetical protein
MGTATLAALTGSPTSNQPPKAQPRGDVCGRIIGLPVVSHPMPASAAPSSTCPRAMARGVDRPGHAERCAATVVVGDVLGVTRRGKPVAGAHRPPDCFAAVAMTLGRGASSVNP